MDLQLERVMTSFNYNLKKQCLQRETMVHFKCFLKLPGGAQCVGSRYCGTSRELVKPAQGSMVLGTQFLLKESHFNGDDHTQRLSA